MVAVDCNVLAYLLLAGAQTPRARALLEQDADWHSDALLIVELTHVLATAMRVRGLAMSDAAMVLTQAQGVVAPGLHAADHHEVLATAARYRVSAYDARYLVVARELGVKLVTEDQRLRKAAPRLTQTLADAVGY
ncbi:MAG: type II toxin-antitoxin system VapC family toxin [Betaproteobacteria bacterium]